MSNERELERKVFELWISRFNVRDYDCIRSFGAREWYFVLSRRRQIFDLRDYREHLDEIDAVKTVVIDTPFLTEGRIRNDGPGPSVQDLTCYGAWCMREVIEESSPELAEVCRAEGEGPPILESKHEPNSAQWWDEILERDKEGEADRRRRSELLFKNYHDLLVTGPYESNFAYVEIDLSAPDDHVIGSFKAWLAKIRQDKRFEHSPISRLTDKEIARWVSNRVLPYIDIMLIARVLNIQLTNSYIGSMLFNGRDFDPAEKIRKTVAPMARQLLSYEMLEALKHTAAAEKRKDLGA